jgi:hypothetical protein
MFARLFTRGISRRLAALAAAVVLIGALGVSAARPPAASAQCFGCWWGGGGFSPWSWNYGPNNWWGGWNGWNGFWNGNSWPWTSTYQFNPLNPYAYNYYFNTPITPVNTISAAPAVSYSAPTAVMPAAQNATTISGQYCKDKTGGQVWVPAGAPPDPALTC